MEDSNLAGKISDITGNVDTVWIETKDGTEYEITKKLPVLAGNIFHAMMMKYGVNENLTDIIEESEKMLDMLVSVIIAANRYKYPNLTKEYILGDGKKEIEGQFDEQDLSFIYGMYLNRWLAMTMRKMKSRTKAPESKDKKKVAGGV